jgi:capsular polysaccharide biosynthesis protein
MPSWAALDYDRAGRHRLSAYRDELVHLARRRLPNDEGMTLDFWDLTKVLFRRWRIAIPLLLLTAGLTVLTFSMVKPNYVSTSYIQLVPPVPQPAKPNQPVVELRNPWLSQGLQTLGNAAIVTILDQSVIDHMKSVGFSDSYTVEMGSSSPLVTVEVVAKSRPQAEGTADELVSRFNMSITSLQTAYGVTETDLITARRLDLGNNVEKSSSNVKRALVAVFGAGLLLTIAATVGIDAWLRRRRGPSPSTIDVAAHDRAIGMAIGDLPEPTVGHPPRALVRSTKLGRAAPVDEGGWYGKQPIVYQTATRAPAGSHGDEQDYEPDESDDATIVIPNFLPKNGAEIIPPPSEWLVNDRDGDA